MPAYCTHQVHSLHIQTHTRSHAHTRMCAHSHTIWGSQTAVAKSGYCQFQVHTGLALQVHPWWTNEQQWSDCWNWSTRVPIQNPHFFMLPQVRWLYSAFWDCHDGLLAGGTVSISGEYDIEPRIIFITDGHITEGSDDPYGLDTVSDRTNVIFFTYLSWNYLLVFYVSFSTDQRSWIQV